MKKYSDPEEFARYKILCGRRYERSLSSTSKEEAQKITRGFRVLGDCATAVQVRKPNPKKNQLGLWVVYRRQGRIRKPWRGNHER